MLSGTAPDLTPPPGGADAGGALARRYARWLGYGSAMARLWLGYGSALWLGYGSAMARLRAIGSAIAARPCA